MKPVSRILSALLGCMAVMLGAPAHADDSEVFTNSAFLAKGALPNVLFVIDTSGSMTTKVNVFDPAKAYTGACPAGRIYWQTADTKVPPDCSSNQWVSVDNNRCTRAYATYATDWRGRTYVSAGFMLNGWWRGRTMMLQKKNLTTNADLNPTRWGSLAAGRDWKIECRDDKNVHGDLPATTAAGGENKYPRNGTTGVLDSNRWGNNGSSQQVSDSDWNNNYVSLYTSDYINWWASTEEGVLKTRFEIVRDVAVDMVNTLQGVNLGLMRYSTTNQGGMVTHAVGTLDDAAREVMTDQLENDFEPDGYTPLSETFYEAFRYLSGGNVKYGETSKTNDGDFKSVAASRVGGVLSGKQYDSPMDYSCANTFIVYLTDGLPTEDVDATTNIDNLSGTTCADSVYPSDPNDKNGRCMEALAKYLYDTDLRTDVVGKQNVTTYMIGFGEDVAESKTFLDKVAAAGGSGQAYTQTDAAGLKATLEEILSRVQEAADTTFVAPAVSVNAFNRSQNLNELYMSVFAPSKNLHWPGNLKKYRILKRELYGTDSGTPAVNPTTGYIAEGVQALNSPKVLDGPDTKLGGAAATLEDSVSSPRKIYTYLETDKDLTAGVNAFTESNTGDSGNIKKEMLGAATDADAVRVVRFARGHDENDEDKTSDFHHKMGDPMHSRPAILIHGGTEEAPQGTVFVATNDGVLHAFDIAHIAEPEDAEDDMTAQATTERWAYIPKEFLLRQNQLFRDAPTANRRYALDGDVKVLKFDAEGDGIINGSDKAYVYFSTGRGGNAYYALDVTNIEKPKFLWKIDNATTGFANLGRTWSTPQIGRVLIGNGDGQTSKQRFVLIFGGGYDTRNDNAPLDPKDFVYGEDSVGNSLYIVDAEDGKLLWSAGKSGTGYNFTSARMTHSFPANVATMDTDSDRFIDRIYAADVDGKVWRFDIANGNGADTLVTGGVLASIGNGALTSGQNAANARRFYSGPDVASIANRGMRPFMNIAIGSGYRGHPLNKDTQDRFYSIRDYDAFTPRTQASYTSDAIVTDSELVDVTDMTNKVKDGDLGWKIDLKEPSGDPQWRGEKNLSEATTAAGVILFTTFTPLGEDPKDPCLSRSMNRVWGVYATTGDPFTHWIDGETGALDAGDRHADLNQNGIASSVQVLKDPEGTSTMGICNTANTVLKRCVDFGSAIRSYWEHQ
jgi:type IV pilus assembly protein PilY1